MKKIELSYTTKLEAVSDRDDVGAILDAKLEATSPAGVVDYVGLALDHIQAKRDEIKLTMARLKELDAQEADRAEHIKEKSADWLEDTGIDKLDGLIVSSMTIYQAKPKEELIIDNEDALINAGYFKTVLDKSAVKKALQDGAEIEGAHIDIIHVPHKIKVNKSRKKVNTEVEQIEVAS